MSYFVVSDVLQKAEVERCFKDCGKIIVGIVNLGEIGFWIPCRKKKCPFEEKTMSLGKDNNGEKVIVRKLKSVT